MIVDDNTMIDPFICGADRIVTVAHPGSHMEAWVYLGGCLIDVFIIRVGELTRFWDGSLQPPALNLGRLSKVTQLTAHITHPRGDKTIRLRHSLVTWWGWLGMRC